MLCRSDRAPRNRSSRFPAGIRRSSSCAATSRAFNLRCAARHTTRGIRLESRVLRSRNRSAVVSSANDCINAPHPIHDTRYTIHDTRYTIHDTRVPCIRPLAAGRGGALTPYGILDRCRALWCSSDLGLGRMGNSSHSLETTAVSPVTTPALLIVPTLFILSVGGTRVLPAGNCRSAPELLSRSRKRSHG